MRFLSGHIRTVSEILAHPLNAQDKTRAVGRYLAWNLGRRLLRTEYVVPLAGEAELIVSDEENYGTLAYVQKLWDWQDMMLLLHMLRPGDLFVDIGANVGAYSMLAGRVAGADVVAIEPVPQTFRKLLRNSRLNGLDTGFRAVNAGLAEEKGELRFTNFRGGLNHVSDDPENSVAVPVETLDGLLGGRAPAAIKIDVEGYELHVLRGGGATLASPDLQVLVIELNASGVRYGHSDDDVHALLCGHGFQPHGYDPATRALAPRESYARDNLNTIYARPGSEWLAERVRTGAKVKVGGRAV